MEDLGYDVSRASMCVSVSCLQCAYQSHRKCCTYESSTFSSCAVSEGLSGVQDVIIQLRRSHDGRQIRMHDKRGVQLEPGRERISARLKNRAVQKRSRQSRRRARSTNIHRTSLSRNQPMKARSFSRFIMRLSANHQTRLFPPFCALHTSSQM